MPCCAIKVTLFRSVLEKVPYEPNRTAAEEKRSLGGRRVPQALLDGFSSRGNLAEKRPWRCQMIRRLGLLMAVVVLSGFGGPTVEVKHLWAASEDQHDVSVIAMALTAPIPPEAISRAQEADDTLLASGEIDGQKVYLVTDDRLTRTQSFVRKLLVAMNEDEGKWVVRVLDTEVPTVNAFVMGGKYIYVYTGLLGEVSSDDELAFILSHEIGHSILKHQLRQEKDTTTTLANLADLIGAIAGEKHAKNVGAVTGALRASYGQADEEEADAIAVVIARHAGFDPLRGQDFFTRLARKQEQAQKKEKQDLDKWKRDTEAAINECNRRIGVANSMMANGQRINPAWASETDALCDTAEKNRVAYNQAVEQYNESNGQMAAIYSSHPGHQSRIAAVTALTDYVAGRRPLESLQKYQQSYRVMAALKQTDSALMKVAPGGGEAPRSPQAGQGSAPVGEKSEKTMSDQLRQLKQALDDGLITKDEYEAKRKQILDKF